MKTSSIITALLPLTLSASAQVFPQPDGPYKIQWVNSELVDSTRPDPFNATHDRRLMISHFTPILNEHCVKTCKVPYMPEEVARIEDEIFTDYLSEVGWPSGVIAGLEMEVCCEVAEDAPKTKFPTLLFGPGLNTTRLFYSATGQHLASKGYEVIVLDHPYETDVVFFPNGDIIFGGRIGRDPIDLDEIQFGLDVRTADVSFVLDTFKICKTTYLGHSFGGASAAAALLKEKRILSGANLDGALWGPVQNSGVSRPFLSLGSEGHNSTSEASWASFFAAMDADHPDVWNRELSVEGSLHNTYGDYPLIADVTGLRENQDLVDLFFGQMTGVRAMEVLSEYVSDFVEFTLRGDGEGLLAGESPEFPEVVFVR